MRADGRSVLILAAALACAAAAGSEPLEPPPLSRTVVLDNLRSPWGMAFVDANTVLITEKEGGLVVADVRTGKRELVDGLPDDLVDDIRSEVPFDNGGLFDVALDPAFESNRWVYLSYAARADTGRTTKVIRGRLRDARLAELETLLVATPFTEGEFFHYGGGLAFGDDGMLYVTVGERIHNERDNPALPIAQDPSDRRGKIYRLNPDGSIPEDNPDFGPDAVPGLYAMGIRAAQGITRHPWTGALWFSEHGSRQGDEINRLVPGANYGWPIITTGGYRNEDYEPPSAGEAVFAAPVWSWGQTVAPTGLAFYQGDVFPEWQGDLLVSGLSRGSVWRLDLHDGRVVAVEELFVDQRVRSRDIAVAPDGEVYLLTDTLLRAKPEGGLDYTGEPGGQLLRVVRHAPTDRAALKIESIAPGVWTHTTWKVVPPWGNVDATGLIVATPAGVIIVDSGWNDADATAVIEWVVATLKRTVSAGIFTHAHDDKMGGVRVFRELGIPTFAHALSNRLAPSRGLTPAEFGFVFDAAGDVVAERLPDTELLSHVAVFFPGAGHTADNIVVSTVDGAIVFGGCLIRSARFSGLGNTADGDVPNWSLAVDAVAHRFPAAAQVIPSHGPRGGPELLAHTRGLARAARRNEGADD